MRLIWTSKSIHGGSSRPPCSYARYAPRRVLFSVLIGRNRSWNAPSPATPSTARSFPRPVTHPLLGRAWLLEVGHPPRPVPLGEQPGEAGIALLDPAPRRHAVRLVAE